jgi:hypothetical protein
MAAVSALIKAVCMACFYQAGAGDRGELPVRRNRWRMTRQGGPWHTDVRKVFRHWTNSPHVWGSKNSVTIVDVLVPPKSHPGVDAGLNAFKKCDSTR